MRRTFARTSGRKGRGWRECQAVVRARSDICCWCGHPAALDVNHDLGLVEARALGVANDPDYCSPIHGIRSRCPVCPKRWSPRLKTYVRRACNSELGNRPLHEALRSRGGSRRW
jgi:hypothetical protein